MTLSVVIVNYNVCDLLLAAIESLEVAMQGIDGEIIVVDNASTDGAVESLATNFPHVNVIALDRNLGFGAANNLGIDRAVGEYVLILNPDTIVQEDTIRVMLAFMRSHPDAVFAGCRIILPDGTLDPVSKRGFPSPWSSFCRVFGLSRLFPRSRLFGGYNLTYVADDATAPVDALAGCFMFCRRDELLALGGFDTDFFMYGEDLDLCYRARKRGGAIYYHPETSIIHLKGESTRRSSVDALALFYEAMEIFARKHFRRNPLLLWLVRLGIALRRGVARITERFPGWSFAPVDVTAAVAGFVVGSIMKFGTPFNYPEWAVPIVWCVPPLLFVASIAGAGGYGLDERTPTKTLLGVLIGFFVLSTLPYFFKDYAFSRGVVVVTTSFVGAVGVVARVVRLLWRRTFGGDSIRRVAILSRGGAGEQVRRHVRRLFVTRPVVFVGSIAPTVEEMHSSQTDELGSVDNIIPILRDNRLTDIVVVDPGLGYTEVIRAMELAGSQRVRFHVLHGRMLSSMDAATHARQTSGVFGVHGRPRKRRRFWHRVAALVVLLVGWPAVYWVARHPGAFLRALGSVVRGRRELVGSGASDPPPLFAMTTLAGSGDLSATDLAAFDESYHGNGSFLLDAEIIIGNLRGLSMRRGSAEGESVEGLKRERAVGRAG